jgi:putative ABC transport system permease protein
VTDLGYALRQLARAPMFAVIVILTVALGIGANTAIFSLVRAVVLQPLPYGDPDQLVMIWGKQEKGALTHLSGPEARDYAAESATFANVAVYLGTAANLTGGQDPERVVAVAVTPNMFDTLGVQPLVGRGFTPTDDPQALADAVVLSHSLWQRRFGGSRDVLDRRILVDGAQMRVAGVMPQGFKLPLDFADDRPSELWRALDIHDPSWGSWGDHSLVGVARLRDGVTPTKATATLRALEDRWIHDKVGGGWTDRDIKRRAAIPVADLVLGDVRVAVWVVAGAVALILLIACANVANLLLARSDNRHREIAVRTAIGASRARVLRQLLTESVVLFALGGAVGLGMAYLAMRAILLMRPPGIPRIENVGLDGGVLAFTTLLAVATGILFGLAPAIELTRPDLTTPLKEGGWSGSGSRRGQRFRGFLAVLQMAFSVVLLVGALLLVRTFVELRRIDLGFNPQQALTLRTTFTPAAYPTDADVIRTVRTLRRRFAEFPGVEAVGATRLLPLSGTIGDWSITLEGRQRQPGENPNGDWQVVTPGYFESMGIRLVRGRLFAETDSENAPVVAVINETMARRYWPNDEAIGKRFRVNSDRYPWVTVVGIVGQVRHNAITEPPRAEMYVPHAQWAVAGASTRRAMTFVLRTSGDPLALLSAVRETVRSIDPNLPLADVQTLEQVSGGALSQARFTTLLLGLFAVLAALLATIGIYGVISLLVARRRREIGIRMALGARPGSILGMVMGRGMALASLGVAAGIVTAAALSRVVATLLYGVTQFDPFTFAAVPVALTVVALCACIIPARRAARVSPIVALREE